MLTLPKTKTKKAKPGKNTKVSALDSAQRELHEKQMQIQAQIDAIQRSMEEVAPRRVEPSSRNAAPAQISGPRGRYVHQTTLSGGRRVTVVPAEPRRRPAPKPAAVLRVERDAARQKTLLLCVGLAIAVMYAASHVEAILFALSHLLPY